MNLLSHFCKGFIGSYVLARDVLAAIGTVANGFIKGVEEQRGSLR